MHFDEQSDVTIVITSCGRFDLLKKTVDSLDKFNTYPVKKVLITEDSGSDKVLDYLPAHWIKNTSIFVNKSKLGQIKSIDLAYGHVDTEYIFHCEDDWLFYRSGFIEDSITILENNKDILLVRLRDFDSDIKIYYPFHYLGDNYKINDVEYFRLCSNHSVWDGFSFNPGLRRKSDYLRLAPFYNGVSSDIREGEISIAYKSLGLFTVILKNSAVEHIGWETHVLTEREIKERKKKKKMKIKYSTIGFVFGCIFSSLVLYSYNYFIFITS